MAMYFGGDFVAPNNITKENNLIPFKLGQITSLTKDDLKGLTEIEPYMFYWDWKLESIAIPNTVTKIGNYAFSCTNIKSLDIPESITSIEPQAFLNMLYLKYLDLSKYSGVVYLYNSMFNLKKLSLGNSSNIAFSNFITPSLEEITISDTNPDYFIKNNCLINNKNNTSTNRTLCKGGAGAVIPTDENITRISSYAFTNTNLPSNVVLPSTLTTLSSNAFYWVTGVESLTIPASVTSFNNSCLYNIESLKSLIIEGDSDHTSISNYSFNYCFFGLLNLENLSINKNFTSSSNYTTNNIGIGGNTEDGVSISFGSLVTSIPYGFLYWTPGRTGSTTHNLTKTMFSSNKGSTTNETIRSLVIPRTKIKEITNWGNITTINNYAFYYCDYKNIVIPNNITKINNYAYQNVYNTETVYYDANVTNITSYSNRILCSTYMNPEATFTFGPNVTSIPSYLLGTNTSSYKTYFKHIRFTENSQVTELPTYFTAYNNILTDCLIPASVETIQSNAFSNCSSLETIYYEGSESDWNNITINDTSTYLANANKIYFNNHIHKGYVANSDGTLTNTLGWRWDNNGNMDLIGDIGEWTLSDIPCSVTGKSAVCNVCGSIIYNNDPHNIIEDTCSICNQKIYEYEISRSGTSYPNVQWEYLNETNSFECNCPTSYSWSGIKQLRMTFNKAGTLNFDYYTYFGSTSTSYSGGRLIIYKNGYSVLNNITPTSDLKYANYSIDIEVGDIILFEVYKSSSDSSGTGNVNYGARIKNITFKESFNEESN